MQDWTIFISNIYPVLFPLGNKTNILSATCPVEIPGQDFYSLIPNLHGLLFSLSSCTVDVS